MAYGCQLKIQSEYQMKISTDANLETQDGFPRMNKANAIPGIISFPQFSKHCKPQNLDVFYEMSPYTKIEILSC